MSTDAQAPQPYAPAPNYQPPDNPVRMLPPVSRGTNGAVGMVGMAQLGAEAAARGVSSAKVTQLLQVLQTLGIKVGLEMFTEVSNAMHEVHVARLQELVQQVRGLPQVQMPVTAPGLRGILGQAQVPVAAPAYVSLDQVLQILAQAQVNHTR